MRESVKGIARDMVTSGKLSGEAATLSAKAAGGCFSSAYRLAWAFVTLSSLRAGMGCCGRLACKTAPAAFRCCRDSSLGSYQPPESESQQQERDERGYHCHRRVGHGSTRLKPPKSPRSFRAAALVGAYHAIALPSPAVGSIASSGPAVSLSRRLRANQLNKSPLASAGISHRLKRQPRSAAAAAGRWPAGAPLPGGPPLRAALRQEARSGGLARLRPVRRRWRR